MPGVKADILAKVVQFMQHHRGVEPPILEKPLRSKVKHKQHTTHTDRRTAEQSRQAYQRDAGQVGTQSGCWSALRDGLLISSTHPRPFCLSPPSSSASSSTAGDEGAVQGPLGC